MNGKCKYSFTLSSKIWVSLIYFISFVLIKRLFSSINKNFRTSIKNSFRSSFHEDTKILVISILIILHVSYEQIKFNIRTKWNLANSFFIVFFIRMNRQIVSSLINIHYRLNKLDETSLRCITFAMSLDV